MNKKTLAIIMGLALPVALMAAEHPEHPHSKEHPTSQKDQEKTLREQFNKAVKDYVEKARVGGGFKVHDDKLNKDWDLKLVKVHKNKIVHLSDKPYRCFACADFKSTAKGDKTKVDLDFYATKDDKDVYAVEKVLIHKVNGQPRYTYNDKNEMVPVTK